MIDIHVLTYSGTRQDWLDQCLASLDREPCTVHVVEGVEGGVGPGRAKGYGLGEHPYVGFVDCDDYVIPGVMDRCLRAIQKHDAACSLERAEFNGRPFFRKPRAGHHLFVVRRSVVEPLLPKIAAANWLADKMLAHALKPVTVPFVGYVWRLHDAQAHHQVTRADFERELAEFA